ncbi:hypothetical protein KCP69_15295 [Salmonella enterica subsp. enterica]|nr:hypothetical protein KCP69_15295 [Salmonella enterica subsp. enterica]
MGIKPRPYCSCRAPVPSCGKLCSPCLEVMFQHGYPTGNLPAKVSGVSTCR